MQEISGNWKVKTTRVVPDLPNPHQQLQSLCLSTHAIAPWQ